MLACRGAALRAACRPVSWSLSRRTVAVQSSSGWEPMSALRTPFIQPVELRAILKGPDKGKVLVLDVRDLDEVAGGRIKGSLNIPAHTFGDDQTVDTIIKAHLDQAEQVVVHCYLSQQRGPYVARRLASRLSALGLSKPEVLVLARGWRRFSQEYGDDEELVEIVA